MPTEFTVRLQFSDEHDERMLEVTLDNMWPGIVTAQVEHSE